MSDQKIFPIETIRHSRAHLLAQAVQRYIDPTVQLGTGPWIEHGFYYDMAFSEGVEFGEKDLKELTKSLRQVAKEPQTFVLFSSPIADAYAINDMTGQKLKNELLDKFAARGDTEVTYYLNIAPRAVLDNLRGAKDGYREMYEQVTSFFVTNGTIDGSQAVTFLDLCAGPHVDLTKEDLDTNAMKLHKIAGAYRQADENNAQLTRLYGLAFEDKDSLQAHETMMEEAKKRDHRVLGKKLQLFTFSERVGAGLPLFLPNGETIKFELETYMRQEKTKLGYKFVTIPHIAKRALYETSGHMGKYDAMMPTMTDKEGNEFVMKAMNCPHHFELYNATPHSYKQLPLRYAENTTCYRNEKTGELSGLTRVKCLTQDDTHHFVRHDQIAGEVEMILGLMEKVYKTFDFHDFKVEISVRDSNNLDQYFGDDEVWNKAESTLIDLVEKRWVDYSVEEGEAAFYGPKIDIKVKDAIGRSRQLTTVQLDFIQPENFDMTYTNEKGEDERPAVLHVAILGSSHRFMGVLIEHFAGVFPVRLAPIQTRIISVADTFNDYAYDIEKQLKEAGIRAEVDDSSDSFAKKIRNGEMMKIPYLLVVGQQEMDNGSVNVRSFKTKEQNEVSISEFTESIIDEYRTRAL
jgi:threonyl-tRNA synthetase